MAESTVRALERQLQALQKTFTSIEQGKFPKSILILGQKSSEDIFKEIDLKLKSFGLCLQEIEELGLNDQIVVCRLPWLKSRGIGYSTLPMPGSE